MAWKAGKWTTPAISIPMSPAKTCRRGSGLSSYQTTNQLWRNYGTIAPVFPQPTNTFIAVIISEKPKNPFVTQWTVSVERELARNTTLEVNYIGNKGSQLLARQNINQALPLVNGPACYASPEPDSCHARGPPSLSKLRYLDQQFLDRALQLQRVELQV